MPFEFSRSKDNLRNLAFARVRDAAYDAVCSLWQKRKAEGVTQQQIAEFLERDPAWVSRNLSGPGNWTLRTFGELSEALDGYVQVVVIPKEDIVPSNYDIYADDEGIFANSEPLETSVAKGKGSVVINMKLPDADNMLTVSQPKALAYAG